VGTGLTIDELRARVEKARAAFIAVGGELPDPPDVDFARAIEIAADSPCDGYFASAVGFFWAAAQANVSGDKAISDIYAVMGEWALREGEKCLGSL
jgi:hypothetical protein